MPASDPIWPRRWGSVRGATRSDSAAAQLLTVLQRSCRPVRALFVEAVQLYAIGNKQLAVACNVICPVAGQSPLALGTQCSAQFANDQAQVLLTAVVKFTGPNLNEARQIAVAIIAWGATLGLGTGGCMRAYRSNAG